MGCDTVQLGDGRTIIVCSRGQRQQKCSACSRPAVALCDYKVIRKGKTATCDSPMCEQHRHPVPGMTDTDWCEGHWNYDRKQDERQSEDHHA